jgi:cellulose synthase/poly-beta-1,6-N-acetylglucosamine synthase-like glycosyltransferase
MLIGFASVLSLPLLVIGIELLISVLHKSPLSTGDEVLKGTYKLLIPAHNEADIIEQSLSLLIQQGVVVSDIIVVADNCTDATADIAKGLGVTVIERSSGVDERGKGFALDYGIRFLKTLPTSDIVIILDADCELTHDAIITSVNRAISENCPVQMLYLMRVINQHSFSQRIAGFAWLVKNKVRPIAVNKLGCPVILTGTGMVFPREVMAQVNIAHGNIVEDMQLGIDCTLDGFAPILCEQAVVYSDFPDKVDAEKTQRTRWEHGHLMTIFQQVPLLIKQAVVRKEWRLLGLALDMSVPPLALLVMLSMVGLVLLSMGSCWVGSYTSLLILFTSFVFFAVMLITVWWMMGREYLTTKEMCSIPAYIFSKISIYVAFIFNRQKSWVKTDRKGQE